MNSMNRTAIGLSFVSAMKSAISESLIPFMTTQLTLVSRLCSRAASMALSTCFKPLRRATNSNLSSCIVSSEMFTVRTPAAARASIFRDRRSPFVVMASCRTPGVAPISEQISSIFGYTKGSPPVRRIFETPNCTKSLLSLKISSWVNKLELGVNSIPSAGMQYWQRRLQRSVREIRRYVWFRPKLSISLRSGLPHFIVLQQQAKARGLFSRP
mmetsp:Transcript_24952/g.42704  ORF Transcript_24952/g.42704 Transcript_24952/m.42704 type:complete len:213 (+) Transcript_24952:543-1181(+)